MVLLNLQILFTMNKVNLLILNVINDNFMIEGA